ncbi:MAG: hypothetical protein ACODAU_01925 [Myxococcota bacterium]
MKPRSTESRPSPLVAQVVLLIAFLLLAAVGVVTVLLPELREEPPEPTEDSQERSREAARSVSSD